MSGPHAAGQAGVAPFPCVAARRMPAARTPTHDTNAQG